MVSVRVLLLMFYVGLFRTILASHEDVQVLGASAILLVCTPENTLLMNNKGKTVYVGIFLRPC